VIGVYLRYNFRARLDDGRNPATAAGLAVAIEELAQSGTVGWIRLGDVQAAGRIVCLPGDKRRVRNILAHRFGELVDLKLISQVASPAPGLDRLFVLGPRKPKPRASADRAATGTDRKVGSRPRIVMRVAGIDHHGVITGWVYCSRLETPSGFSASVNVDGRNLGTVPADRFNLAALRAGLRDGECAFSFRVPAELLDGEEHTVSIMGADSEGIFANKVVKLVFPKRIELPSRPWRDIPTDRSRFLSLKSRIIAEGVSPEALAEIREAIEADPYLVFLDMGLAEAARRAGDRFPSFRDRLVGRLAARDCPAVIHEFDSRVLTAAFCAAREIRTARPLLVTKSVEEFMALPPPDRFAIKPAKGRSAFSFLYDNGLDLLTRKGIMLDEIAASAETYLGRHPGAEIIVEELVRQRGAAGTVIPIDYRLHVFGGRVRFISIKDRNVELSGDLGAVEQGWFSKDWRPSPFPMRLPEKEAVDFAPPDPLPAMIDLAERIGTEAGDYVRVDLYDAEDGITLAKVAIFSNGGTGFTQYGDRMLAQAWVVSPALPRG
jgi:hypothetical protein